MWNECPIIGEALKSFAFAGSEATDADFTCYTWSALPWFPSPSTESSRSPSVPTFEANFLPAVFSKSNCLNMVSSLQRISLSVSAKTSSAWTIRFVRRYGTLLNGNNHRFGFIVLAAHAAGVQAVGKLAC
jgi:hypothetical protein